MEHTKKERVIALAVRNHLYSEKRQDGGEDYEEWLSSSEERKAYRSFLVVRRKSPNLVPACPGR